MRRTLSGLIAVPAAAAMLALAGAGPARAGGPVQDPVPVGPHQFFAGVVNHHRARAVIQVVCGGPATTGHPQAGQKVKVVLAGRHSSPRPGFTGRAAHRIRVWLTWPSAVAAGSPVRVGTFTSYFVAKPIPVSVRVPCSGRGLMIFVPVPGSRRTRSALVHVRFESRGV
jgi:hypothetical protein